MEKNTSIFLMKNACIKRELFVLLLMTILPQSLLTLVGSNLMPFPFLTAGHAS
jgi:hypothetical protein